ncbi:chemotaxis sensor histidine kinase/response regulator [Myxococcus xanthus DK 1622]|uniref:histidine kinase n=1 Tax=Myxococcus xanthus (strain DK1622) TaxID=246197 RepID=Q1CZK9_MYXXD|nr:MULTISPECIES: response regulator [Myxococcus]ABF88344.1 chemotaxis sensor histidine kinase/response regulator [Myxococcus xanthus DK 1622]NOJ58079.1 response regulator [Myxococcus xanthus]QPM78433.1 response regulator [Myxococcus xanthus]QVW67501.1 response regulator [Myxococcus xanthus DZ2]QZZ53666.1 Sensor histidine kinase RcsC [Myxococcus xanthus]
MPVDPMLQGLVAGFAVEAQEVVQKVTMDLLELEREGLETDALTKLYVRLGRHLHTLKGSAASLGMQDLSDIAHKLEDALAPLKANPQKMPRPVVDILLHGLDLFLLRAQAHADGRGEALPDPAAALAQLVADAPPPEEAAAMVAATGGLAAVAAPVPSAEPVLVPDALPESADAGWRVSSWQVTALMREVERLREVRLRVEERGRELERVAVLLAKQGLLAETAEARTALSGTARSLRTDGEETSDIVDALEDGLKAITTRPVRTILDPLQRMVRDLSRQLGKEARLSVVGAEVSLDRRLLEKLQGSLVHLLRNAVDHGLELPADRERAGKHHEGALTLRVEQQGNLLYLEASDDGAGIDVEVVRRLAEQRGVVTAEETVRLNENQLRDLIFRSGFSTRTDVTDTSGRGVGLDAVRASVEALQGRIEVASTPGQGTRFMLTLPTDLGSSPVLVVRVLEQLVGLPMLAVEATQLARAESLRLGKRRAHLEYQGQLLSVVDLGARLGLRALAPPAEGQPLLIVQSGGKRVALVVDAVVGDRDLVIRPLPSEVRDVPAWQGAATLSRGELLLICRPDWLVTETVQVQVSAQRRALVVDDSLTARALHRAMLEAGGFTVHLAASGARALDRLQSDTYDVVICDLDMEEMDGIQLIAKLRERPETASLPVILVSAHDSSVARERGLKAGADGYLSKRECAAGRLLAEVLDVMSRRGSRA